MNTAAEVRTDARWTVEEYLAWLDTRPSEERWQLIDGVAMMMPPPTTRHQAIASNLLLELKLHVRSTRLPYVVLHEVGLIVPELALFRPMADVAVVDAETDPDASYADRFFLVAEILSESNSDADVATKLQRYQLHPDNRYVLIISQTEVLVEVYARSAGWEAAVLTRLDDKLDLPDLGFACQVRDIYRDTSLA
jgi:Uma2 family endonuclease